MPDIIFTMQDLKKVVPPKREILKGIWLSFFWGAKIGVLGHNGAGKSTLLKIMAGIEKEFDGEAFPDKKAKVGFLEQEPQLDPSKTVLENVMDGVSEVKELLDRFNTISDQFADPDLDPDKMNELLEQQGKLQDRIEAVGGWELESTLEIAMDALRCPPGDAEVANLSGGEKRRVALCRLLLQKPDAANVRARRPARAPHPRPRRPGWERPPPPWPTCNRPGRRFPERRCASHAH